MIFVEKLYDLEGKQIEMINITTYSLQPYFSCNVNDVFLSSEWFRESVNEKVRKNRIILESESVDISLFFNHNLDTGKNRIGYPLIIYHYFNHCFYLTGINEGANAVSLLAKNLNQPFSMDGILFDGFKPEINETEVFIGISPGTRKLALIEWIPLHYRHYPAFREMTLVEKAAELNQKLFKHISEEMGRFLGISFENLTVELTDITRVYPAPLLYKGHEYHAFDVEFITNAVLPPYLTLGNNKSMGYGRIIPL